MKLKYRIKAKGKKDSKHQSIKLHAWCVFGDKETPRGVGVPGRGCHPIQCLQAEEDTMSLSTHMLHGEFIPDSHL